MKVERTVRRGAERKGPKNWYLAGGLPYFEDLKIANMVKNHHLSKSISDASWGKFLQWVKYYGAIHDIPIIAVSPKYTTQDCSECGTRVKKSLSVRTHICTNCGIVLDRDHNAAITIREAGLKVWRKQSKSRTVGHTETASQTL